MGVSMSSEASNTSKAMFDAMDEHGGWKHCGAFHMFCVERHSRDGCGGVILRFEPCGKLASVVGTFRVAQTGELTTRGNGSGLKALLPAGYAPFATEMRELDRKIARYGYDPAQWGE